MWARSSSWRQILDQKKAGRASSLISAELDEIYALSDRIVTIYEGRITGEYRPDAGPEEIASACSDAPTRTRRADGCRRGIDPGGTHLPPGVDAAIVQGVALLVALGVALLAGSLIAVGYGANPIEVYGAILNFAFWRWNRVRCGPRHRDAACSPRSRLRVLQGRALQHRGRGAVPSPW